jgi:hypothetical protein
MSSMPRLKETPKTTVRLKETRKMPMLSNMKAV